MTRLLPALSIPGVLAVGAVAVAFAVPSGGVVGDMPNMFPGQGDQTRSAKLAAQLTKERGAWSVERRRYRLALAHRPSVAEALTLASVVYGVPRAQLSSVAWCESRHDPRARNGRYRGLFQEGPLFGSTPFGRAGLSVWSPYAAAMSAAYIVRREGWRQWQCQP